MQSTPDVAATAVERLQLSFSLLLVALTQTRPSPPLALPFAGRLSPPLARQTYAATPLPLLLLVGGLLLTTSTAARRRLP